jgi:hypothetical protein
MTTSGLSAVFVKEVRTPPREIVSAELDLALRDAFNRGQEAWLGVRLSTEQFGRFLGRVAPRQHLGRWLANCLAGDLWLACARLVGEATTRETAGGYLLEVTTKIAARLQASAAERTDLQQELCPRSTCMSLPSLVSVFFRQYTCGGYGP